MEEFVSRTVILSDTNIHLSALANVLGGRPGFVTWPNSVDTQTWGRWLVRSWQWSWHNGDWGLRWQTQSCWVVVFGARVTENDSKHYGYIMPLKKHNNKEGNQQCMMQNPSSKPCKQIADSWSGEERRFSFSLRCCGKNILLPGGHDHCCVVLRSGQYYINCTVW